MSEVNSKSVASYANVTQSEHFPNKDQAIVLDAINEIPVKEYTKAIGEIIKPSNIRFVSRISNNRVCLFLTDKKLVNSLVDTQTTINIGDHKLVVRPLILRAKRIILSNVCPIISHQAILDRLNALNISVVSPITFIKARMAEPGYAHIQSFRRQVFIQPDDVLKLPEYIQMNYDSTNFWIYISIDNPTCFICKKEGHLAKYCNNGSQLNVLVDLNTSQENLSLPLAEVKTATKRSFRSSNSTEFTSSCKVEDKNSMKNIQTVHTIKTSNVKSITVKKPKMILETSSKELPSETDEVFLPIKDVLQDNANSYVLNYAQFKDFIVKAAGKKNIAQLASDYTKDVSGLSNMLKELYPKIKGRVIKNRITRIIKTLAVHLSCIEDTSSGAESDLKSEDHDMNTVVNPEVTSESSFDLLSPEDDNTLI